MESHMVDVVSDVRREALRQYRSTTASAIATADWPQEKGWAYFDEIHSNVVDSLPDIKVALTELKSVSDPDKISTMRKASKEAIAKQFEEIRRRLALKEAALSQEVDKTTESVSMHAKIEAESLEQAINSYEKRAKQIPRTKTAASLKGLCESEHAMLNAMKFLDGYTSDLLQPSMETMGDVIGWHHLSSSISCLRISDGSAAAAGAVSGAAVPLLDKSDDDFETFLNSCQHHESEGQFKSVSPALVHDCGIEEGMGHVLQINSIDIPDGDEGMDAALQVVTLAISRVCFPIGSDGSPIASADSLQLKPFSIIYFHHPSVSERVHAGWLLKSLSKFDRRFDQALRHVIVIHGSFGLKVALRFLSPFVGDHFWSKLTFLDSLSSLDAVLSQSLQERIELPESSLAFEEEQEYYEHGGVVHWEDLERSVVDKFATRIQAVFRGYRDRLAIAEQLEYAEYMNVAASIIQSAFRLFKAKVAVKAIGH